MIDYVTLSLLAISLILLFGFFSEFVFRRFGIPDVLFLILLGFGLGPYALNYLHPDQFATAAPIFTTFTLLFLLFDGAFNINLKSLIQEFSRSFMLTTFNFFLSSIIIAGIMYVFQFSISSALFTGFALGGVSSAFVIPVLQGMQVKGKIYSLLALESALTDVFCIVFALTVIEVVRLGTLSAQALFSSIVSLFAIAMLIGVISGVLWIILVLKVFKEHNYMMTIAFLILVYVITQFLGGNGAIATLFFGLMLNNSKQLTNITKEISGENNKKKSAKEEVSTKVTTRNEQLFYRQISFFLKTFFFVYIGILIDLSDTKALMIGILLSFLLMGARYGSFILTKEFEVFDRKLVNVIFARGLAAAAIAQIGIAANLAGADFIAKVIYVTITGTIILSSLSVFIIKKQKNKADLLIKSPPRKKGKKAHSKA